MSDHIADMLDTLAIQLEVRASEPASYYDWLVSKDYKVDRFEYATHKQFLEALGSARDALKALLDGHARGQNYPITKFSKQEADAIKAAFQIIDRGSVPLAALKLQKDEDPLIF